MKIWMRVALFAGVLALVDWWIGGVWGVIVGLIVEFSATVFANSPLGERQAVPGSSEVARSVADDQAPRPSIDPAMARADHALDRARLAFVLMFAWYLLPLFFHLPATLLAALWPLGYVVAFLVVHVALGRAAQLAGRNPVTYGLVPVLLPVLGALISFGILRSRVPHADA